MRVHLHLRRRDEQPGRRQAAHDRRAEQRAIVELDARDATRALPGRERDENERDRPDEIEVRPLDVAADRRLVEVDGVADRVQQQSGGDQRPRAAGLPARDREDEDDEREQEHVADRIGEVRDHDERASVRGVDDDLDEHRREPSAPAAVAAMSPSSQRLALKVETRRRSSSTIPT